ncbi:glycosyl hydrolase [Xylariomycetidae sp. FL0641]|nr:glycosyl hydrolase [Xylariomycetidae sp. FL0641]
MTSISAANNALSFVPSAQSYFYENLECIEASSDGYNALSFSVDGPSGASFLVEIQTKSSCAATTYTSTWHNVTSLTGSKQVVSIPLSSFSGANPDAITAFVWSTFSETGSEWQLGDLELVCKGETTPPTSGPTTTTTQTTPTATTKEPSGTSGCTDLLIDDWESQSRLTFLGYNAMIEASSDDATMKSIVVSNDNHVTLAPKNSDSYFYSQTSCMDVRDIYGGISMTIKAPKGTSFTIELSSPADCGTEEDTQFSDKTTKQLGWAFDGSEKLFSIPFSEFPEVNLAKFRTVLFTGLTGEVTFGPMVLYCGSTPSEYTVPATTAPAGPTSTVPAPSSTASPFVIDTFGSKDANTLGFWHGGDEDLSLTWGKNKLTIKADDPDYAFYTQVTETCRDMTNYQGAYLHIVFSGSNKFTIALEQHNSACDESIAPFPETWDSLEAARYTSGSDIYMPLSHFNIDHTRVLGFSFKGFYTTDSTVLSKVEIVSSVPASFKVPNKLPSGNLVFACKRPNSFAFAIDDGDPAFAQEILRVVKEEGIKVTFFTVGAPLEDPGTNLTNVYNEMKDAGHQIALHSFTHPPMEGLSDYEAIDWEYNNDIAAVSESFAGFHTPYFRPPFGNEGARMRQRLATTLGTADPYVVMWSVDVEDWLWAETDTPEKQLDAFKRDVGKGGNLVVMHYLYESTVGYLQEFIQIAKATGKELMRVDQCMEDPNAPPL